MFVKVVQLPPFRAASFHIKESETPERDAWAQLKAWAQPRGLFDNPTVHQVYGRNNPTPGESSPLRGYEFWVTIPDDYPLDTDIAEVTFPGGLYAVVQSKGIPALIENYERIFDWIRGSLVYTPDYPENDDLEHSPGRELEHHINPNYEDEKEMLVDAYVPIRART
jgi:DNA gyrase inhibitor GyrI